MFEEIRKIRKNNPIALIMAAAILLRLLAVIFARGWGMFDDHFIVIESSQSWVDGHDYNSWLPGSPGNTGPTGHNLFYPGLHFLLFSFFSYIHLTDPQVKMFIVRLIHAALSLLTVYYGYRITEKLSDRKSAELAGILLALFWFMPWMSVRNLVEMASVPFLILGYWFSLRAPEKRINLWDWIFSGVFLGLAADIRLQTALIALGFGLVILFRGKWKQLGCLIAGSFLSFVLIEGGIDYVIWGRPFAELLGYINVCLTERNDYISLPWYNYILVITGMLIPPVSLFLLFGFFRKWRKLMIIFIPVLLFLLFHSWFPNKQERFIIPAIPLFIIAGTIGWTEFREKSVFWANHRKLIRSSWIFFWIINITALLVMTFTYSKRSRVESMRYLSRYSDIRFMTAVDAGNEPELFPKFYLGQWPVMYNEKVGDHSVDSLLSCAARKGKAMAPRFILFTGDSDIRPLVIKARKYFPRLVYEATVEPGFIDWFVHWLNPVNKNRRVYIYRNTEFFPLKLNP